MRTVYLLASSHEALPRVGGRRRKTGRRRGSVRASASPRRIARREYWISAIDPLSRPDILCGTTSPELREVAMGSFWSNSLRVSTLLLVLAALALGLSSGGEVV